MPAPRWKPESREAVVKALEQAGSLTLAADLLGCSRGTLRAWCRRDADPPIDVEQYQGLGGRKKQPPKPPREPLAPGEQVEQDALVHRLTDERDVYKKLYKTALKKSNLFDDVREIVREVMEPAPPVIPAVDFSASSEGSEEDAILALADWHGGEVVDEEIMHGWNRYDPIIMCRRALSEGGWTWVGR